MDSELLFISCSYPPVAGTASRGNQETAAVLQQAGFEVTVIGADFTAYPRDESLFDQHVPLTTQVFHADDRDRWRDKLRRFLHVPGGRVSTRWKSEILEIAEPWYQEHSPAIVYSVFGNGSEHAAALNLRRQFDFYWVAEFRDPWLGNWIDEEYLRRSAFKPWQDFYYSRVIRLLRKVVDTADLILVESPRHREQLISRFGHSDKILTNYLGTSSTIGKMAIKPPFDFTNPPVIGFVGKTYFGYEDLGQQLIQVLKALEDAGVEFTFVSAGENFFSQLAAELGLISFVALERLPYAQALGLVRMCDFSLVVVPECYPANINSKVYEAVQLGVPILGLAPPDGCMADLIREHRLGEVLPLTSDELSLSLRRIIDCFAENTYSIPSAAKTALAKENLMQPVIDRMNAALGRPVSSPTVIEKS